MHFTEQLRRHELVGVSHSRALSPEARFWVTPGFRLLLWAKASLQLPTAPVLSVLGFWVTSHRNPVCVGDGVGRGQGGLGSLQSERQEYKERVQTPGQGGRDWKTDNQQQQCSREQNRAV